MPANLDEVIIHKSVLHPCVSLSISCNRSWSPGKYNVIYDPRCSSKLPSPSHTTNNPPSGSILTRDTLQGRWTWKSTRQPVSFILGLLLITPLLDTMMWKIIAKRNVKETCELSSVKGKEIQMLTVLVRPSGSSMLISALSGGQWNWIDDVMVLARYTQMLSKS